MKVVCFSEVQWRYLKTRKQQIITRFPRDWEVLFLSSVVRGRRNNFRPERDGRITHVCIPVFKNFPQRSVRALFAIAPVRFLWNALLLLWLGIVFRMTGFSSGERVFYVSNIYYAEVLSLLSRSLLLYDCNDDPLGFRDTPGWAAGYFRKLVGMADVITAVSGGLVQLLKDAGASDVRRLGNGVDYELFNRAAAGEAPREIAELAKPVIGYVGAIGDWFDFGLVERLAAAFPSGSIALVGPVYSGVRGRAERMTHGDGKVVLLGPKPYESLGGYIAAMDVCIVPLVRSGFRRAADPNKLYEYAALGKPVVTFAFSEDIAALGEQFYIARDEDGFIAQVHAALERGADEERLRAFARRHSWQAIADEMVGLIEEGIRRRHG